MDIYVVDGREIVTHSMVSTMRRCPRMFLYKYIDRLKPKFETSKPLKRGTWLHSLLEAYYKDNDWKAVHRQLTTRYNELTDDEKIELGDLPRECAQIMRSYLWHYGADPSHGWIVHDVEFTLDVELPDGSIYRCKIDALIENLFGLWIVDHKSHKTLPDFTFRLLDVQSALYLWAALMKKLKVQGFIWNYIRTKPPTVPQLVDVKRSPRLSTRAIDTDYPTYRRAITNYGLNPADYKQQLRHLRSQRWQPDMIQTSEFFQRHTLEKHSPALNRVRDEMFTTHDRMLDYDWNNRDAVERVVDRSCKWRCSYTNLCATELLGGNADLIKRQQYKIGDPNDYYQDQKEHDDS